MAACNTQGTIVAANPFNPEKAGDDLRKAMKGFGTDEAQVIRVITGHTNAQRQEIKKTFKTQFGKDLRQELKSELSGNFEDLVLALLEPPRHFDAFSLKEAIKGAGTDEAALIEILCSRSNEEILEIKQVYKTLYKSDLEKDIMSDTSGHFKRLLVSQVSANRDTSAQGDQAMAEADCEEFYKAGAGKFGTDESTFNRILSLRSHQQLCCMFDKYRAKYGKEIEQAISSETSGYLEDGYLAIVKIAKSQPKFFAERLYKSMKGMGTNDRALIRTMVSRSEVDLALIKREFQAMYGKTLESFIKGDCSGDYKKCLLALCGEH